MSKDERRRKAREIAELRYWFRWHLLIYAVVNAGFVGIWYYNGAEGFPWPFYPVVFWGLGLAAHYLFAYHIISKSEEWMDKETEKILKDAEKKQKT